MTFVEYVNTHGTACGGNWAAMLMSALMKANPELVEEGREYAFAELAELIETVTEG